jgi:hypothetical protein
VGVENRHRRFAALGRQSGSHSKKRIHGMRDRDAPAGFKPAVASTGL